MQPQQLAKLWEATQVELQGRYSSKRVLELARYTRQTSLLGALAVALASSLPCLLVEFLIDAIPLADPSEGVAANKMFFVREFLCIVMTTGMIIHQFRSGTQTLLPYAFKPFVRDSIVVSALTIGLLYELAHIVGFPIPFMALVILPGWSVMVLSAMAIQWIRHIRENLAAKAMLAGMTKLMLYTTRKISDGLHGTAPSDQTAHAEPFARAVRHLGDETPELVIFNADAFGSLFVAYCMQSSPSIWSTIVLISADVVLISLSLRDILHCREGLENLEDRIDSGSVWGLCRDTVGYKLLGGRKPTTLERASILLERAEPHGFQRSTDSRAARILPLDSSHERPGHRAGVRGSIDRMMTGAVASKDGSRDLAVFSFISRTSTAWMSANTVYPEEADNTLVVTRPSHTQISKKYVLKVRRLLYMAEFLLLLNYIEVVIPQIFGTDLSNRNIPPPEPGILLRFLQHERKPAICITKEPARLLVSPIALATGVRYAATAYARSVPSPSSSFCVREAG
ncbi:hypothetical protein ON010_g3121 [Phytophthora cinnamomi]|nr:hypothetical protein ON010_g3121 [Phytophthora cinnamomi]